MIGYQKELGKFFSTVNIGGTISFLISKKEPVASEDIQIINLDHKTSMQINTNWLLEFNVGLGYHISRKIDFEMEPAYKYYIGSLNKNNDVDVKHPYSLGIISGFYFKF